MKHLIVLAAGTAPISISPACAKPGHAKRQAGHAKTGWVPPDQTRKRYNVGHKFNRGFKSWTPYNRIQDELSDHYKLSTNWRHIYDRHYIYRVDPVTVAVGPVLAAAIR